MDDVLKLMKVAVEGGMAVMLLLIVVACVFLVWKHVVQPMLAQHGELMRTGALTIESAKVAASLAQKAAVASEEAAQRSVEAAERNRETAEILKQETVRLSALCQGGRKS